MGNYVSEQMDVFLRSIVLGSSLGLVYDLLRALRRLGGRAWGGFLDALFCLAAVASFFLFVMSGDGEVRIFILLGTIGGAVLFLCLLSPILRPLWNFWLDVILIPVGWLKNFLGKIAKYLKKLFSFSRKWVTMLFVKARRLVTRQRGDQVMPNAKGQDNKKKKRKRHSNKLLLIFLAVLALGVCIQINRMYGKIQSAKIEEAAYAEQLAQLQETNNKLQQDIDHKDDMNLISDIARNELGLVGEGEKIFRVGK